MKKNIFKSILLITAMSLCVSSITSCTEKTEKKQTGKKSITVWTSDRHDMDIRQKQVAKFNEENTDNILIDYQVKSDDFVDALKISYQSKTAPDIHPATSLDPGAIKNGWYRELDSETVKKYKSLLALETCVANAITDDGKDFYYTVTTGGINSYRLIWNKDLFKANGLDPESPPKTWDELKKYSEIITKNGKDEKYGYAVPLKDNVFVDYYVILPSAPSGLCNVRGYDPSKGKYDYTIYGRMIDFIKDMNNSKLLFPSPSTLDNDTARAQFSEGNIGMMMGAYWDVGVFNDQFPAKIEWGATDIPTFDGKLVGGNPANLGAGTRYVMNANSKYPDEQLKVWNWLNGEENLKELQLAGKGTYCYKSLMKTELINTEKKGSKEFYSITNPAYLIDSNVKLPSATLKLEGDGYIDTLANIIKTNMDTKTTLQDLTDRYNGAFQQWLDKEKPDKSEYITPEWNGIVDLSSFMK